MTLSHEAGPVAPPVAAGPARALVQELCAVLQGGLDLALLLVLDPGLPLVAYKPASDKVVVVGVENVRTPLLCLEALEEVVAGEDLGPISAGAAGHARGATVDVVGGGDLKVAALNVRRAQPVEDAGREGTLPHALDPLASTDTAHLGVFERSQDPGHQSGRPCDIVVGHDGDLGGDFGEGLAHLEALVGDGCRQNLHIGVGKRARHLLKGVVLVAGCDEEEAMRLAGEDALEGRSELFGNIVNGGDDDGHVVSCERRLGGYRLRLVYPVADAVHEQTCVAVHPGCVSCLTFAGA